MRGTISTPASRAARQTRDAAHRRNALELGLLALALAIVVLAIGLAWFAKTAHATVTLDDLAAGRAVDLNALERPDPLVPLLVTFDDERERRLVAGAIVDYIRGTRAGALKVGGAAAVVEPHPLTQVGELSRVRVPTADLDQRGDAPELRARLATMREGRFNPETMRVLDGDDLRALRPQVVVRSPRAFSLRLLIASLLFTGAFALVHIVRRVTQTIGDGLIVPAVCALCGLGLVTMISVNDPLRDRLLFDGFAAGVAAGAVALAAMSQIDFRRLGLDRLAFVFLAAAAALSVLLLVFGSGPGSSGVKVNLFGVQPVELIRPLVAIFLASYFSRRWEFLRELRATAPAYARLGRLALPRPADLAPVVAGMALVLLFFFFQHDLGPALVISSVFLATYSVARGRGVLAVAGLLILVAGFAGGYWLGHPSTVVTRITMWLSPWDNPAPGGDQVAQALWALASGGVTGQGPGRGGTGYIPTGENDLVLASLGEDFGFIGLVSALALFGVFIVRALRIARRSDDPYLSLLVVGLVTSLAAQAALIAGGLLGLLPLSGVVTPFLSAGRSSMISNLAVVGLILAAGRQAPASAEPLFARPVRTLSLVMAIFAAAVVGRAFQVQVMTRAETMGRPVRTKQADGATRFQDNPRLREVAQLMTRGAILDRNGLPLASSDWGALTKLRPQYAQLGVAMATACPNPAARCYPFGGSAFHLLGDASTRANWGASNTQFVEREADARLRGFGSRVIEGRDGDRQVVERGGPAVEAGTILPDYAELLPLWDHRGDLSHPAAQALLTRPRDVTLTIDARLQMKTARLLADRLERLHLTRGAVVVLDAPTGDVLALVSYPWPTSAAGRVRPADPRDGPSPEWLDRARFGQYPPGSTFKLVTAAAALLADRDVANRQFTCRHLSDDRVGNELAGWRRPVRDDPTDRVPHGSVTLEEGMRVSCNAYFAQLGIAVGPRLLRDTAAQFGIVTSSPDNVERLRGQLPWASYGQAEVLASPFTMARVAATFADDGAAPAGRVMAATPGAAVTPARRVLSPEQARRIARAMRLVVTNGTAHGLMAGGDPNMAGKTGTAEVTGAPSHSWFVGFAPALGSAPGGVAPAAAATPGTTASAAKTIAFAVIVENGGYGASVAVPIGGEVVAAARGLGIVK
jgi:cell division protein FtsW (lipid II flippase)/cell division protein FtsI/penicillin-binding protein 2